MNGKKQSSEIFSIVRNGTYLEYSEVISDTNVNLTEHGQNLLQEATANNKVDIAADLVERGIDLNYQDTDGATALNYCIEYNDETTATLLIQQNININIEDKYGNQALWYAVFNARGEYNLVNLLLANGADAHHKNHAGRSPLDFASQINDRELIFLLTDNEG